MVTQALASATTQGATATPGLAPPRIEAVAVRTTVRRRRGGPERVLLDEASLAIEPGEVVAIVGGSGAGKTTLLNTLAGVRRPTSGSVSYDGHDLYRNLAALRSGLGYVPQDDIVHAELTVERTLRYAAKLRLAPETAPTERDRVVRAVIEALGLVAQAGQRVGSLSGGQRKRVSIGVELLTKPSVFFLDEPTSGLDPATGREMMRLLRRLAEAGSTIVLTSHAPQDIELCDRVIVLAQGGSLVFAGPPREALEYFEVGSFGEIYERVATIAASPDRAAPIQGAVMLTTESTGAGEPLPGAPAVPRRRSPGALRQWGVLTQRTAETLARNHLTLAILAGSPLLVIAMMAVLFRPGAFEATNPDPIAALMTLYWVAFAAFFFGLTYGLLMICTEMPIVRRERLVNLRTGPYVAAKVAVLLPVLAAVTVLMLGVLRLIDRLPAGDLDLYGPLALTLLLEGAAAIALGLLASAAVTRPEQATLALPMICFPQVLFSGAILPVAGMAEVGRAIAWLMTDKWAFEALGTSVRLDDRFAGGSSAGGASPLAEYGTSFAGPVIESWAMLAASFVVFLALTGWVLARKSPA